MDLEQKSIERLKAASDMSLRLFQKPLLIAYSGGKDVFHWWMEDGVLPGQMGFGNLDFETQEMR